MCYSFKSNSKPEETNKYYIPGLDISTWNMAYTKRGSLNLQSLLFTHWTNVTSIYLSCIILPVMVDDPRSRMFPNGINLAEYCKNQLLMIWNAVPKIFHISSEERSTLFAHSLINMHRVSSVVLKM